MRIGIKSDVLFNKKISSENINLLKKLKSSGNNIYIILREKYQNESVTDYKLHCEEIKKSLPSFDKYIDSIDMKEDLNKLEIVLNKEDDVIYYEKTDKTDKKELDFSNLQSVYEDLMNTRFSYYDEIKPRSGYPSIDKLHYGFYTQPQKNVDYVDMSIYEYLLKCNEKNMNNTAIDYYGNKITFKTFFEEIDKCAKAYKKLGAKKGDKVAICMPNTPEGLFAFYAAQKLGMVACMAHPLLSEKEFEMYFNEIKPKYAIAIDMSKGNIDSIKNNTTIEKVVYVNASDSMPTVLSNLYNLKQKLLKKNIKVNNTESEMTWKKFISGSESIKEEIPFDKNTDKVSVILRTGGSDGIPKGVELTDYNFNNSVQQLRVTIPSYSDGDCLLAVTPIFHGFGLANCIHTALCTNMSVVLLPRFDLKEFINTMLRTKSNLILGVPTLWKALTNSKKLRNKDLSFLKVAISGGDKLTVKDEKKINDFFEEHQAPNKIFKGYGLTEALAATVFSNENANVEKSTGIPLPGNIVKIVDNKTNEELTYEKEGEICISSPTVMKGYHNNEESTKQTIKKHSDGLYWLHTGDLGYIDKQGRLVYTQRLKRVIISSGYNLYPNQIEEVIQQHPLVDQCIVVPKSHSYKVNVPKAYIVLKNDVNINKEEVLNEINKLCEKNLSKISIPKDIEIISQMPRTAVGKTDYKSLEKLANVNLEYEENYIEQPKVLALK